jgi:hypothetical protein
MGLSVPTCTLSRTTGIERASPAAITGPRTWPPAAPGIHPDLHEKREFWISERQVGATSTCGRQAFLTRTTIAALPSESKVWGHPVRAI